MVWGYRIDFGREQGHVWKSTRYGQCRVWGAEQVGQDDFALLHSVLLKYVNCFYHCVPRGHDGVHKQHLSLVYVVWEAGVDDPRLVRIRIPFHEYLSDTDGPTTIAEALLH